MASVDDTSPPVTQPASATSGGSSVERALEYQLRCQTRISHLSRFFLTLPADQITQGIQSQLPIAAELSKAESVSLALFDPGSRGIETYWSWLAPGSGAEPLRTDDRTAGDFKWFVRQLLALKVTQIDDVSALPAEAAAEQADMRRRGVLSSLTVPVRSAEGIGGFFSFERLSDAEAWSESEVALLQAMVEIFAAAANRQRHESALREQDERFSAITEHATELIAEIDHLGVFQYVSPSYRNLLGHEPADLIGQTSTVLVHPEDLPDVEATFRSAFIRQGEATATPRLRHADGSWRWIEISGRAFRTAKHETRLVSMGRDITPRMEMEQALQRQRNAEERVAALSRHFLQLSTDEIEDGIRLALEDVADLAGADRVKLTFLTRNEKAEMPSYEWPAATGRLVGTQSERWRQKMWSAAEFVRNQPIRLSRIDQLPPEAAAERADLLARNVRSMLSIPIYSGETPMGCLVVEATSRERSWCDQDVTQLRLIGELFTSALRRRQTEVALADSRQQLLQAQKMDAVGRLAGGIAHDFNNLLTIILGFSRPLMSEIPEDDPIREDISAIQESAERAASLTRQLLTFSRRQSVAPQEIGLNDLLRALEPMLERMVGPDVDLGLELQHDLDPIEGDPHQFEQLVLNIAANARDAMPDGGSLVVRTRNQKVSADERARLGLANAGHFISLQIQDTGVGMDEFTQQRIFDPFFTTKEADKGTGLGLSLVYGIVEQVGGAIAVAAEPGKGTSFQILLPRMSPLETP
jgi:PAS domain S-box-containing protein